MTLIDHPDALGSIAAFDIAPIVGIAIGRAVLSGSPQQATEAA